MKLGWISKNCGCCFGIEWGGDYPRECRICGGDGIIYLHVLSGVLSQWPGGPFVGKEPVKKNVVLNFVEEMINGK